MKVLYKIHLLLISFIVACMQSKSPMGAAEYRQITIAETNTTPTVDIKEYTLITTNESFDSADAVEILELKRKLPLVMQKKDSLLFESILSDDFSYRGEDEFYNHRIPLPWIQINLLKPGISTTG